jgi:transcriptional regulator with XRE-family HTH domain
VQRLDAALEPLYRERMRLLAVDAIEDMVSHGVQQQRIESQLGIARGYLSKIKSGDRVPSPELSLHLALIGLDPLARLAETEEVIARGFKAAKDQYHRVRCLQNEQRPQAQDAGTKTVPLDTFLASIVDKSVVLSWAATDPLPDAEEVRQALAAHIAMGADNAAVQAGWPVSQRRPADLNAPTRTPLAA